VPTRVLLEGPAIEPLLAQVRQQYGSGVRIISADKVRSGGFGGFFARQHYELSVEVPDHTEDGIDMAPRKTIAPPPRAQEAPHTLEQLLERAESNERIAQDRPAVPRDAFAERAALPEWQAPAEPDPPVEDGPAEQDVGRGAGIDDTDDRFRSDAGAAFAELLAGLDAGNHIATTVAAARPSPRPKVDNHDNTDTPTVRPFRPAQATGAPINGGSARPLPPVPSLAELMGGLGLAEPEASEPPKPSVTATVTPVRSAAAAYGLATPSTDLEPTTRAVPPMLRAVPNDPVVANLISVGMPEAMATQITGGDTYAGVLAALASRPSAPGVPDAAGEILVLAGELAHAIPIAKRLLEQIGVDQTHLLLAGPSSAGTGLHSSRVMHDAKAAAIRAEKLQSADAPWVVVLDAPIGATDPIWVNDMCDAIGATAVWAVVDATRKTADTARHLRTLGDVEALIVHGVDLTADPATVLGLDLPIVSLDGKPATPHAWAAMLCARIAADVTQAAAAPRRVARTVRR
jgi:hypothetical protein